MEPDERVTPDEIRERAYDLWDRHHRLDGFDLHFWFMAQRELRAERMQIPDRDIGPTEPPSD